jgi:hypothetical protein
MNEEQFTARNHCLNIDSDELRIKFVKDTLGFEF